MAFVPPHLFMQLGNGYSRLAAFLLGRDLSLVSGNFCRFATGKRHNLLIGFLICPNGYFPDLNRDKIMG